MRTPAYSMRSTLTEVNLVYSCCCIVNVHLNWLCHHGDSANYHVGTLQPCSQTLPTFLSLTVGKIIMWVISVYIEKGTENLIVHGYTNCKYAVWKLAHRPLNVTEHGWKWWSRVAALWLSLWKMIHSNLQKCLNYTHPYLGETFTLTVILFRFILDEEDTSINIWTD